ncbi:transposase, partial [bacterium]|nr:transposase [bacterium]
MLIAHKTRLHPNNKQLSFFRKCSGVRRFAYNWALGEIKRQYEDDEVRLSIGDVDKLFNVAKKEHFDWAYEVPSCVGQEAIKSDLKSGMNNFFRNIKKGVKAGYPKFKSRGAYDSFTLTNVVVKDSSVIGKKLKLPKKMGTVRLGDAIRFKGRLMSTTISRRGERWYASFLIKTEEDIEYPTPDADTEIGIDLGVRHFASLSNGEIFEPAGSYNKYKDRLKREQRKLAKMQQPDYKGKIKASNNWKKQNEKVRKIYRKITSMRENYSHQVSTNIVNRFE